MSFWSASTSWLLFSSISDLMVVSLLIWIHNVILFPSQIADVWSCGVTLYVMLVGAYPFEDPEEPKNFRKTIQVCFWYQLIFYRFLWPLIKCSSNICPPSSGSWMFSTPYQTTATYPKNAMVSFLESSKQILHRFFLFFAIVTEENLFGLCLDLWMNAENNHVWD